MPKMAASTCPVPSCHRRRSPHAEMCTRHWRLVSQKTKDDLRQAWDRYVSTQPHGETWSLYQAVRERAIQEAA